MGWDAFSSAVKVRPRSKMLTEIQEFKKAANKVRKITKTVDCFLAMGGLDCSICAFALQQATGQSCWSEDWSAEKVQELAKTAHWPIIDTVKEGDDSWAILSAKAFLETCAKLNCSIHFSW
jgi:hypothetical protein